MVEANWKSYGLIALVGLFLFTQLLRHLPGTQSLVPWETEGIHLSRNDQPYSVKTTEGRPAYHPRLKIDHISLHGGISPEQLQKFAAANAAATETAAPVKAEDKADDKTKKKLEKCDEKNPKVDPKTGLALECKKKKSKDAVKPVLSETPAPSTSTPTEAKGNSDGGGIGNDTLGGGIAGQSSVIAAKKDDQSDTLEAWQKRLLGAADLSETKVFIDRYQKGLVTADVYYQIVEQMVADSRDDMKQLGIMCAGVTPSVISFQILAKVESGLPSDSTVRASAETYLAHYSDLTYLGILARVLRTPASDYSTVAATQRLDTSAQRYLRLSTATPANTKSIARVALYFQPFVAILTGLEKSTNTTLAYQSKRALTDVQSLVASAASTTASAPAIATASNRQP